MTRKGLWTLLPIVTLALGLLSWTPNLIFGAPRSFWLITFVINPVGLLVGWTGLRAGRPYSLVATIGNALVSASFFLVMLGGYLGAAITGGTP